MIKNRQEVFSDAASEIDLLGFTPYISTVMEFLLAENTKPPMNISIEGAWGVGKTSFMKQLRKTLEEKSNYLSKGKYLTVWFDAWKYENSDGLCAAFALDFLDQLKGQFKFFPRWWKYLKMLAKRITFRRILNFILKILPPVLILLISFLAYQNVESISFLKEEYKNIIVAGGLIGVVYLFYLIFKVTKDLELYPTSLEIDMDKMLERPDYKNHVPLIRSFHDDFDCVLKNFVGKNDTVFVFVDDLDRLDTPNAANLLKTLMMISDVEARLFFIFGMEPHKVAASIACKHKDILPYIMVYEEPQSNKTPEERGIDYGMEFIEKFIQQHFRLPKPDAEALVRMIRGKRDDAEGTDGTSKIPGSPNNPTSGGTPINGNRRPIVNNRSVKRNLSVKAEKAITRADDMDDIAKMVKEFAPVFKNNPRSIKRFVNLYRFSIYEAACTGRLDNMDNLEPEDLTPIKLAKIVAFRLAFPREFESVLRDKTKLEEYERYISLSEDMRKGKTLEWEPPEDLRLLLDIGFYGALNVPQDACLYKIDFDALNTVKSVWREPEEPKEQETKKEEEPKQEPPKAKDAELKTAEEYFERGLAKYALKAYQEAIDDYSEAIRLKPDLAEAFVNRGAAKYELKDNKGAIADYDRAIELKPGNPKAFYNRGVAKRITKDNKGEIADYNKAIDLFGEDNPKANEAFNNRAAAYISLAFSQGIEPGQHEYFKKSKADAKKAHYFSNEKSLYNLACAEALLLEKQPAFIHLNEALEKGIISVEHVENDEDWDHLRNDPGYIKLIEKFKNKSGGEGSSE